MHFIAVYKNISIHKQRIRKKKNNKTRNNGIN